MNVLAAGVTNDIGNGPAAQLAFRHGRGTLNTLPSLLDALPVALTPDALPARDAAMAV